MLYVICQLHSKLGNAHQSICSGPQEQPLRNLSVCLQRAQRWERCWGASPEGLALQAPILCKVRPYLAFFQLFMTHDVAWGPSKLTFGRPSGTFSAVCWHRIMRPPPARSAEGRLATQY